MKSIGYNAFEGCDNLKTVIIKNKKLVSDNNNQKLCDIFGTQVTTYIIGDNITNIKNEAFQYCENLEEIQFMGNIITIGNNAFDGCKSLKKINIPDGVKNIGNQAFYNCRQLTDITVPNSVEMIGVSAFAGCENLRNITLSQKMKQISDGLLQGCSNISTIALPSGIISIGANAFNGCTELKELNLPNDVSAIYNNAFENCSNLASIYIPSSLTTISKDAFFGCISLKKVIVPDIKSWCGITFATENSYYNPTTSNPLSIAHHLYSDENTEIVDLVIPEGVKNISASAFYGGSSLKSVTIPSSLKSIGGLAFYGCNGLTKTIVPDMTSWCGIEFGDNPLSMSAHLYSDKDTEITKLVIPSGVTSISDYAFMGASSLTSVSLPNTVQSIGDGTFYDCSNIKSLVLPNGMQTVGERAFEDCSSLETLVIPNTVKAIGTYAFANCLSLYSVTSLINMPFKLNNSAFRYTGEDYDNDVIYMAAKLYVPRGKTAMYQMTEGWQKFLNVLETDTKFKLTYKVDGEVYKTYEIQATEVITPEPDPVKEGYIFSGWSEIPYLMPAEDVTITGSFTIDPDYNAAVDGIAKDETAPKAYYTVDGRRHDAQQRGLNIIRMSDGTVRKVMVK